MIKNYIHILMIFLLLGFGFGANIIVPDDQATISLAITAANTGDHIQIRTNTYSEQLFFTSANSGGKTLTLEEIDGDVTLEGNAGGWPVLVNDDAFTANITFDGISINTDNTTRSRGVYFLGSASNFTFNNCDISADLYSIYSLGAWTGTVTINGGDLTAGAQTVFLDGGNITANAVTFNPTNQAIFTQTADFTGDIKVTDCVFNLAITGNSSATTIHTDALPSNLTWKRNTVNNGNAGLYAEGVVSFTNLDVRDNVINLVSDQTFGGGIILGVDKDWVSGNPENALVKNNTIDCGTVAVHGMEIGQGMIGTEVSYNKIIGGNFSFVIKGQSNNMHHNLSVGIRPFYIAGGINNIVTKNTFATTQLEALRIDQNAIDAAPTQANGNVFFDNIFDGSGGEYAVKLDGTNETWNSVFDYNCLNAGSLGLAFIDSIAIADINALRSKWASASDFSPANFWTENDENSIEADPLFVLAGTDNRLLPGSPCLNTAQRTVDGGYGSFGAWQQKQRGSR